MNFFERELRKLFRDDKPISNPSFAGRVCLGTLGKDLRVRTQFVATRYADHYDALKVAVLNRTEGEVDCLLVQFRDVWGKKSVPGNPNFKDGIFPYIWVNGEKAEWYAYQPNQADRDQLRRQVSEYLNLFREPTQDGPKLVYICAPLRGDVEKNIEFARKKAQEVFQAGNIPVCPHLMFPPIADPENPAQDQAAREMGLRLVESCQEVHVYGLKRTEGMRAEIHHARVLGIQVKTGQETVGRSQPHRHNGKGEKFD